MRSTRWSSCEVSIGLQAKYPLVFMRSTRRYSCQILTQLEIARHIFEKSLNIKFHENPPGGGRVVQCGQAAMTKLIRISRNLANAHKKPME